MNKKQRWRYNLLKIQTIPQSYSNQNSIMLIQNTDIDQWRRINSPEINPCTYGQLTYEKGGKIYNGEKTVFSKWCWENWSCTCKTKIRTFSHTIYKNKLYKCFKDPRLRPQTTKLLEENISRTLIDKNSSIFFDESSKAKEIKAKIVKRDVIKLKEFLHRKENHKKWKPKDWDKIFANNVINKGF